MHQPLLGTAGNLHPGQYSNIFGGSGIGLVGTQQQTALLDMRTPLSAGLDIEPLALALSEA
jgi:hypothetical protein